MTTDTELTDDVLTTIAIRDATRFGRFGGEGELTLAGDLRLTFEESVNYLAGDRFAIVNGPEISGAFDEFEPFGIDGHPIALEARPDLDMYSVVLQ